MSCSSPQSCPSGRSAPPASRLTLTPQKKRNRSNEQAQKRLKFTGKYLYIFWVWGFWNFSDIYIRESCAYDFIGSSSSDSDNDDSKNPNISEDLDVTVVPSDDVKISRARFVQLQAAEVRLQVTQSKLEATESQLRMVQRELQKFKMAAKVFNESISKM